VMIKEERREKKRVIAENGSAIAFAPYASRRPFEVAILPKLHEPSFRDASARTLGGVTALLQTVLQNMKKYAGDPDLNFYVHDAPFDGKTHAHHHWHLQILPNVSRLGGMEHSTGIFIN